MDSSIWADDSLYVFMMSVLCMLCNDSNPKNEFNKKVMKAIEKKEIK